MVWVQSWYRGRWWKILKPVQVPWSLLRVFVVLEVRIKDPGRDDDAAEQRKMVCRRGRLKW